MAKMAPEGSQIDAKDYDSKMQELLAQHSDDFFCPYDEVVESLDDMAIQENLLRGIYAFGNNTDTGAAAAASGKGRKKLRARRKRKAKSKDPAAQPQDQQGTPAGQHE